MDLVDAAFPGPVAPELVGREVTCRGLEQIFDAASRRGLSREVLAEGTGLSVAQLTNPRGRMSWEAFATVARNAGRIWTDPELEEIGATVPSSPLLRAMFVAGRLLFTATEFYVWCFGLGGPAFQMFAAEDGRAVEVGPGHVRIEVRMREGYAPSRENFVMAKGSIQAMALPWGHGPADVKVESLANGVVFHVRVAEAGGQLGWMRRSLGWLFAARSAGAELRAANQALYLRSLELQREIDARTAAERDREDLLARLQLTLQGMPIGCLVFDANGRLGYHNPAADSIFGALGRLEGERPSSLFPEGESRDAFERTLGRLLRGEAVPPGITDNRTLAGEVRRCEWHHTPLTRPDGTFAGIVSVCEDVTEREKVAAQLLQAQKMESVGRLAGGIAHDFNNVLAVVMGYASLLDDALAGDARAKASLGQIQRAAKRGAVLASQLLAFSRQQVLEPHVLDLDEVVDQTTRMLRPLLGEDIDVQVRRFVGLGTVRADPMRLEQVLVNLAVNARDAMPEGGRLTFETRNIEIEVAYAHARPEVKPGHYVLLSVTDSGVGMDPATLTRVFEPFFTTKPVGRGTGLGLAMVYGIVRQSGGHVTVYSEPGQGTTFNVYLPRVDAPVDAGDSTPTIAETTGTETLLVVEDDPALRALTVEIFSDRGYRVLAAASPADALAILDSERATIHLLLTDVIMPGMSGVELARRVVAARPAVRVLYTSGYAPDGIVHEGVVDPGIEFIAKPFSPSALAARVRSLLDRA